MHKSFSTEELEKSLPAMDEALMAEGMPLYLRPQECFKQLYGSVRDQDGRKDLFDPITVWFVQKYGYSAVEWDGVLGRIPVIIRGVLYLVTVPLSAEESLVEVIDQVEGIPDEIRNTLTPEEADGLLHDVLMPSINHWKLYTLRVDDGFLNKPARELIRRAFFDLETATYVLHRPGDVQGAIFHAHAAAEKFVKAALSKIGHQNSLKSLGHDLPKAFAKLVSLDPAYGWLDKPVQEIQRLAPSMELRYSNVARTLESGVTAVHASIFLCGALAKMWQFEQERGSRSPAFRAGKFYKDQSGLDHYCKIVTESSIEMVCFRSSRFTGSQLFTKKMTRDWCALYLEVIDLREEERLRAQLLYHLRNPGKKVEPADISVRHVDGPKGTYTVGRIRRDRGRA